MFPHFEDCTPFTPRVFLAELPNGLAQFGQKVRIIAKAAEAHGRMTVHSDTSIQYLLTGDDNIAAMETLALANEDSTEPAVYVSFLDGSPFETFRAKIFGGWMAIPFHMIDLYTATESKPSGWYRWAQSWLDQIATDEMREEFALLCEIYDNTGYYDFPPAAIDRQEELGYALGEY